MSWIHQIYYTRCLRAAQVAQQEGQQPSATQGEYSPRASSLQGEDLRRWGKQIEPELYYQPPEDMPEGVRAGLDPATAPQRLVFLPSPDGFDVLALVCYQGGQQGNRAESNFAHVLLNYPHSYRLWWSNLACLELWGAPGWVTRDSSDIPAVLQCLSRLSQMHEGQEPLIGPELVLKFLTAPVGTDWGRGAAVVTPRWQQTPPARRRKAFVTALSGFLAAGARLILVAEPSVAALWFYGILRLVPNIPIFATLGFSTFEPKLDRLRTALAATCFSDPANSDLPLAVYNAPVFTMNTFRNRCSPRFELRRFYAPFIVNRLIRHGWEAVERFLMRLQVGGADTLEDLETMSLRLGRVRML
ncbi:MAG: hypothetical protein ACUVUC_15790 [Thermoguttaceae bacterium]